MSKFSDFFHKSTEEEKRKVILQAIKLANEDQRKSMEIQAKENSPKKIYQSLRPALKIGQLVVVKTKAPQKVAQGKVISAECFYDEGRQGVWFYGIDIPNPVGEPERVYSYEEDTGDARTKILLII